MKGRLAVPRRSPQVSTTISSFADQTVHIPRARTRYHQVARRTVVPFQSEEDVHETQGERANSSVWLALLCSSCCCNATERSMQPSAEPTARSYEQVSGHEACYPGGPCRRC